MALSININVNNSDISIKNSKTGAKKNIKSISAGNLNDMTDREFNISQKRKVARKQAMKLISDAWDKDNKAAQGIKDMESEKADIANINADLKSKLKDIDKSQKDLQELYGVHSESQEQKDLELLKKYQDNRNGVSNDKFSKEEIDRLKELQNEPLTEYQKKALMINSSKDAIRSQIDQNDLKAMNKTMSINNAKLEQLKSQGGNNIAGDMMSVQMGMAIGQQMMKNVDMNNSLESAGTYKFCPNCGTPANGAKFCSNCGTKLS